MREYLRQQYMREEDMDYLYYIIDIVALTLALVFAMSELYTVYGSGLDLVIRKGALVLLAFFFKYIYLLYYGLKTYLIPWTSV